MKKRVSLIIILFVLFFMGIGLTLYVIKHKKLNQFNDNVDNNNVVKGDRVVDFNEIETDIFNILFKYGSEIYENKKYLEFRKNDNGLYYLSYNDLKLMEYDVSLLGNNCDKDLELISFDIDKKIHEEYYGAPILISMACIGD